MYSGNELKKGVLIELDGAPYRVVESSHHAMGRGGGVMRAKLKNLINGNVLERSFRPTDAIAPADVERRKMQYLYQESDQFFFMDESSYEQLSVSRDILGDQANYLAEGSSINLLFFQDNVIGVEMANSVYLKVVQTDIGLKGDTAASSLKPATVETGANINVPLFINEGDVIKVDTRTGQYLERQK